MFDLQYDEAPVSTGDGLLVTFNGAVASGTITLVTDTYVVWLAGEVAVNDNDLCYVQCGDAVEIDMDRLEPSSSWAFEWDAVIRH